jgi:hypothetical protein
MCVGNEKKKRGETTANAPDVCCFSPSSVGWLTNGTQARRCALFVESARATAWNWRARCGSASGLRSFLE